MKQITMFLIFGALLTVSANAQTYSQPVREVNGESRNAVSGSCFFSWTAGAGNNSCSPYTVPAGKRLIVRDLSLSCSMPAASDVPYGMISNAGYTRYVYLPLQQASAPDAASKFKIGGRPLFFVVETGAVTVSAWLTATNGAQPSCVAMIFGNLSDIQ